MKEAYQVYNSRIKKENLTCETGYPQYKCYCSNCGCPVYSDEFISEREECPHCHAEFSAERVMTYGAWTADLHHVGYSPRECGREQ